MAVPAQRTDSKAQKARHDTGVLWLTQRDIDGLILCGEHYAAPYDLLAAALRIGSQANMYRLLMRWRDTGYAATGQLGRGPSWCWLTSKGMAATGLGFPAPRPRFPATSRASSPSRTCRGSRSPASHLRRNGNRG